MHILDFTIITKNSPLTESQADDLYEMQCQHVNGNCHALTIVLNAFVAGKIKVLHSTDCGIIHSFIECGNNRYVDGWGLCDNTDDIIENYVHSCSENSITVQDATAEDIINLCDLDSMDTILAIEFWELNAKEYDLPEMLKLPNGIDEHNALTTPNPSMKKECQSFDI